MRTRWVPDGVGHRVAPGVEGPWRPGAGEASQDGCPRGAGVLAEVHGERMAGMGLVTATRALERGSRARPAVAASHSGPGNVDV
jgi:hypothetical protein